MDKPNILIYFPDQLRRHALGCYGDPDAITPNLDELAQKGALFEQACSTYPICVPFRFTFMTGLYAHTRQVPGIFYRMSSAERTVADEFNDAGYETFYFGKWHLGGGYGMHGMNTPKKMSRSPVPRSVQGRFQHWYGFELRNSHFDSGYFYNDDPTFIDLPGYQTDVLTNLAIEKLGVRDLSKPFLAVVSVEPPHPPFEAPENLQKKWLDQDLTLPRNFDVPEPHRDAAIRNRKIYYAMNENLDHNFGRLLKYLNDQGVADNTIVVVFADHGEMGGAHGKGAKSIPQEESIGIPLLVYDPRQKNREGIRLKDPTCTEDLYPTLCGLAGLPPRDGLPGMDLAPLISGASSRLDRPGVMLEYVCENRMHNKFFWKVYRGFRTERYKYVVWSDVAGGRPTEFYDLEADPWELENLIDDTGNEEVMSQLHGQLIDRLRETEDDFVVRAAWGHDAYGFIPDDAEIKKNRKSYEMHVRRMARNLGLID